MSPLLVLLLVAGCGGEEECTFSGVVAEYVEQASVSTSCGAHHADMLPPADPTEWKLAHDCVVAAVAAQTSFSVYWDKVLIEGIGQHEYVGLHVDGTWQIRGFSAFAISGSPARVKTFSCSTLADNGDCDTLVADLCLVCVDDAEVDSCGGD